MNYANQKRIIIQREMPKDIKNIGRPYLIAYQDNLINAMKSLSPAAFKVYVCLLFNADGYPLDFSPEHIKDLTGLCKDTIRKALNALEREGFLVSDEYPKYRFKENRNLKNTNNQLF